MINIVNDSLIATPEVVEVHDDITTTEQGTRHTYHTYTYINIYNILQDSNPNTDSKTTSSDGEDNATPYERATRCIQVYN